MDSADPAPPLDLRGQRIAFVGRLASMPRRDAQQLVRGRGAIVVERPEDDADWIVVGEHDLPLSDLARFLDARAEEPADAGLRVVAESDFWGRLGLVEDAARGRRLYTPAMLAELLGVPVAVVRRWRRRGLIRPAREVRRLPYFDFQEVATARRLAEWLASGVAPAEIERQLERLARWLPELGRPLAQLGVIVEGRRLLLRRGEGLVDAGGQLRFDFEPAAPATLRFDLSAAPRSAPAEPGADAPAPDDVDALLAEAAACEDDGRLDEATHLYRAALAAGGPRADVCFALADVLYRRGEVQAARERYYMAIELDEEFVEARANLGCVLAELGERELACAALEGALAHHPDFPDAHFHLARLLDEAGLSEAALPHWEAFLELAADSPWAAAARERLGRAEPAAALDGAE